jgi:hypothetical protein
MRGAWRTAFPALLVLAVVAAGVLPARVEAAPQITAGSSRPAAHPRHRRSAPEDHVATLTKALGLDAKQQAALRSLLQRQREQVRRIWNDESVSSANRIASTKALSKQTANEIRALLNEEQRKKFDPPAQDDPGHVITHAHVEDWTKERAHVEAQ